MQLEEFLRNSRYFSLGHLPTEGFHLDTRNLSDLVELDLPRAIRTVQQIDETAMRAVVHQTPLLNELSDAIAATFARGRRVYLSGCGATGRLALALEATWKATHARDVARADAVQGLMAGGDFALVKSVENFEDFPEYGERHLFDLGFREGDLLIAITEGGETPYVIGTVHAALKRSHVQPWFVFCNPTEILRQTVDRSREVIDHPRVRPLCLNTGPMALSGSTRLQAATAQMLAVGAALFDQINDIEYFIDAYSKLPVSEFLPRLVEWESDIYRREEYVLYQTSTYPIAVLTDTTERSPTFSLTPFEKRGEDRPQYSWCYLSIPAASNARDSWRMILHRDPIGIEWPELDGRLSRESILEFDFGREIAEARAKKLPKAQHGLTIDSRTDTQELEFHGIGADSRLTVKLKSELILNPLWNQLLVKMVLNIHSLMVMGKMQRYEGNVMTWVRPSNGKLIDRTARYLEFLIKKRGLREVSREALIESIFLVQSRIDPDEAVILQILKDLS
ncbi:MAG: SIS domain-containing protein [Bdellovibrionales bacterium]|nr:SIS domain-containing protein [Bdellovibrionales bacterium]